MPTKRCRVLAFEVRAKICALLVALSFQRLSGYSQSSLPLSRTPQRPARANSGVLSFVEYELPVDEYVVHSG